MKCRKTSTLLGVLDSHGHVERGLYINHNSDTRNPGECFSTHNILLNPKFPSKLNADIISANKLSELPDATLVRYGTVCIDEGQFFPDLEEGVKHMVDDLRLEVYVAALNSDYKRNPIGSVHMLVCRADTIEILKDGLCERCARMKIRRQAAFTHRIADVSGQQIEIGAENYMVLCRQCYEILNK
jgi:thymidine kinase